MTTYLDLLPTDVSNLIYQKKLFLELKDELKNFCFVFVTKGSTLPKKTNFKIDEKVNVFITENRYTNRFVGIITKITKCFYVIQTPNKSHRVKKENVTKWYPNPIDTGRSMRFYYFDSGSFWYKPNPIREKYSEYLTDHWVDIITELNIIGGTPMVGMNNPYLTLYLEVHHPELNIVWDRQTHPNWR